MAERNLTYFVSDVHLGLTVKDPAERESRFIAFLKSIPRDSAKSLFLLGDIWDFWYEYRDVVPREGSRVVAQLIDLMDAGVEVYFCEGNHDIWTYSFFEELGIKKFSQPFVCEIGGKTFCLGHGDALGGSKKGYGLMLKLFHCRLRSDFSVPCTLGSPTVSGWPGRIPTAGRTSRTASEMKRNRYINMPSGCLRNSISTASCSAISTTRLILNSLREQGLSS